MDHVGGRARTLLTAWPPHRAVAVAVAVLGIGLSAIGVLTSASGPTAPAGAGAPDPSAATAYTEPPTSNDPGAPGTWLSVGPDETDPFMVVENGTYYLFTSRADGGANVPVRSATVPGHWGSVVDALPTLPAWAQPGWAWAPDVHRFGDRYVLYFTTLLKGSSPAIMCIGDAVGSTVSGPFVAQPEPFICQPHSAGRSTRGTFVAPDGQAFMLWKSDQNATSATTSHAGLQPTPQLRRPAPARSSHDDLRSRRALAGHHRRSAASSGSASGNYYLF